MIVGLKPLGTPPARSLRVGTCATLCYRHVTRDVPPQTSFKSVAFTKVSARKMIGLNKMNIALFDVLLLQAIIRQGQISYGLQSTYDRADTFQVTASLLEILIGIFYI